MTNKDIDKDVAEALGKDPNCKYAFSVYEQSNGIVNVWFTENKPEDNKGVPFNQLGWKIYTPSTNGDQCMELQEQFNISIEYDGIGYSAHPFHTKIYVYDKKPKLAVCKAVIAMHKGNDNDYNTE